MTILVLHVTPRWGNHNRFTYPHPGDVVEATDWNGKPECGGGLHGLPRGCGDGSLLPPRNEVDVVHLIEVDINDGYFEFDGKCKYRQGRVVYEGDLDGAVELLQSTYPGAPVVYGKSAAGSHGTATAGDGGTATAGDGGFATAGDGGTATAGEGGFATAGDGGTATAGYNGMATAGCNGMAKAGTGGTAIAGKYGFATTGNYGKATTGIGGTATAGIGGIISINYRDGNSKDKERILTGYIGEDGLEPNTPYRVVDGRFVKA